MKEMQERLEKLEAVYSEKLKIKELGISVEKET